jgi:YaiO family outer membrane protein
MNTAMDFLPTRRRLTRAVAAIGLPAMAATSAISAAEVARNTEDCGTRPSVPTAVESTLADRFACAQWLLISGNHAAAQSVFEALTADQPGDVDYWFGLAQAQHGSGDDKSALAALLRARELAPDYEQIWRLELTILTTQHGDAAKTRENELRTAARSRFPDAAWIDQILRIPEHSYRWEAGADRDWLDNDSGDWRRMYLYIDRAVKTGDIIRASLASVERFDRRDMELGLGVSSQFSERWNGAVDGQLSPDPAFLPRISINANLAYRLDHGWAIGGGLRLRDYEDTRVFCGGISVERYFGRYRASYVLESAWLGSETAVTHRATVNFYADSRAQLGVTVAAGQEVENVGVGQVLETDISSIALTGSHPLGQYLSIIWRLGAHQQGDLYSRFTTGLSIAGGF